MGGRRAWPKVVPWVQRAQRIIVGYLEDGHMHIRPVEWPVGLGWIRVGKCRVCEKKKVKKTSGWIARFHVKLGGGGGVFSGVKGGNSTN